MVLSFAAIIIQIGYTETQTTGSEDSTREIFLLFPCCSTDVTIAVVTLGQNCEQREDK
jgi:hypothetical protein